MNPCETCPRNGTGDFRGMNCPEWAEKGGDGDDTDA